MSFLKHWQVILGMCLLCVGLAESLINPQHHTLIQFTIYSNRSLCETNAVSYEAHGDHRLRAWQIHRRSCHIDAPRQPLGDNSTGIYLTGNAQLKKNTGKVQDHPRKFIQIAMFIQLQLKLQNLFSQPLWQLDPVNSLLRSVAVQRISSTWFLSMIAIGLPCIDEIRSFSFRKSLVATMFVMSKPINNKTPRHPLVKTCRRTIAKRL